MNNRHVFDELPAFLDGEAKDAERIARHIEACPDCAREAAALRALSQGLRALPRPEARPGFRGRVMARVAEEAERKREPFLAGRWAHWAVTGVAAAALIAVAGFMATMDNGEDPNGSLPIAAPPPADPANEATPGETVAYEEDWEFAPEWEYALESGVSAEAAEAILVLLLEEEPWLDDMLTAYDTERELDLLLANMTDGEAGAFAMLLADYAEGR